jgi:hypothetical protein
METLKASTDLTELKAILEAAGASAEAYIEGLRRAVNVMEKISMAISNDREDDDAFTPAMLVTLRDMKALFEAKEVHMENFVTRIDVCLQELTEDDD